MQKPNPKEDKPMIRKSFILIVLLSILLGSFAVVAGQDGGMTYEDALACVLGTLPAEIYSTNEFIPTVDELENIEPLDEVVHLKVGMPWVFNDEESAFYNAVALGFYEEEGLEIELLEGGPGLD